MTRSRSIRHLTEISDETFSTTVNANVKKKRKASIDDKALKSNPQSTPSNGRASDTEVISRKLKRNDTIIKSETRQTKSKPTKSHETARKKPTRSTPIDKTTNELQSCSNAIQHVLAKNYMDIQKRLKVWHPAKCIEYVVECSEQHARNKVNRFSLAVFMCCYLNVDFKKILTIFRK